jgi:DNA-binding transcriptional ArsR family regulator
MVRTYKALSDERRLRILRRLREGDTSLDELTEMLGLSKSTVHHHMSTLRAAGLIRIHVSIDKSSKKRIYSLRDQALEDASGFLDSYLNPTIGGVDHV